MTSLLAQRLGWTDRGVLKRTEAFADLVLFDAPTPPRRHVGQVGILTTHRKGFGMKNHYEHIQARKVKVRLRFPHHPGCIGRDHLCQRR